MGRPVLFPAPVVVVQDVPCEIEEPRVDFGFPEWGTVHATLDDAGHLQGLDMSETTSKYTVVRVPTVDVEARATAGGARALHLDADQPGTRGDDEVDLVVAVTPVVEVDHPGVLASCAPTADSTSRPQ